MEEDIQNYSTTVSWDTLYLLHSCSDKAFKGTVVNRTCNYIFKGTAVNRTCNYIFKGTAVNRTCTYIYLRVQL